MKEKRFVIWSVFVFVLGINVGSKISKKAVRLEFENRAKKLGVAIDGVIDKARDPRWTNEEIGSILEYEMKALRRIVK